MGRMQMGNPQLMIMKTMLKLSAITLLAVAIAGRPVQLLAQSTNQAPAQKTTTSEKKAPTEKKEAGKAEKKPSAHPFHGKLAAVDKVAKIITVGKSTYQITSETKIKKSGQPAMLEDGVVGEEVSGYVKPDAQGKLAATTVNFGPKPGGKAAEKKKANADTK